jgi:hypothetical protein
MRKKIIIIISIALIFAMGILFYVLKNKDISSVNKICSDEGGNAEILKAIETKYPGSEITRVYDSFSKTSGPLWKLEVKTAKGNIVTENMHCHGNYFADKCGKDDACYTDVAYFYGDINICKKIVDDHVRNNCYALLAGLNPAQWNQSVCEKLVDVEAKAGCIKFFNEEGK